MKIENITPQHAWDLLQDNQCGREVNYKQVADFAFRMRTGAWVTPGEDDSPIVLGPKGELLNGQHRLHAIILTGIPMRHPVMIETSTVAAG